MEKICLECNKNFEVPEWRKEAKFCSNSCVGKSHRKEPNVCCTYCNKKFHLKPRRIKKLTGKIGCFCSRSCQHSFMRENPVYCGSKNPNFKGVKCDWDGYLIKHSDYECRTTVHKAVVLKILGLKNIYKGFQIHHKNCDPWDNRPENLVVLSNSDHRWLHKNFGNYTLAAYENNLIDLKELLNWVPEEQVDVARDLLTLNVTKQVSGVLKLGELLENPEEDNQQPSQEIA